METRSADEYQESARLLRAMAHPTRLRLLDALANGEECVCHLTALLGQRQAYVSQQLMFLRREGLIQDRKEGLRVFYRIQNRSVTRLLEAVGLVARRKRARGLANCPCPHCQTHWEQRDGDSTGLLQLEHGDGILSSNR